MGEKRAEDAALALAALAGPSVDAAPGAWGAR